MPTWKSATLVFLQYNNYYNRIVKREEDPLNYLNYELFRLTATNFNPNDGVNTEHIVNMDDGIYPDYMVVFNEASELVSRWFIIECDRIRGGQYRLTLHRDTVADYYEDITSAPCFIEKATLNYDDPLIFNEEDMSFNQIKTKETLLKDRTGCPWIVGYYDKDQGLEGSVDYNEFDTVPYIDIGVPIEDWEFYQYRIESGNKLKAPISSGKYLTKVSNTASGDIINSEYKTDISNGATSVSILGNLATVYGLRYNKDIQGAAPLLQMSFQNYGMGNLKQLLLNGYASNVSQATFNEMLQFTEGTIIKDSRGDFFTVSYASTGSVTEDISITSGSLFNALATIAYNTGFTGTAGPQDFIAQLQYTEYVISITPATSLNITWSLPAGATKLTTNDAPYNIFAIPYGNITIKDDGDNTLLTTDKDFGMAVAAAIVKKGAAGSTPIVYDVQLLPYCPVQELIDIDNNIRVTSELQYSFVNDANSNPVGIIFHLPKSQFTFNVIETISIPENAIEKKISNQCDKYRLCSPNFNGYFDFSPAKNGGVGWFNVDCYYKPYQPYIHINPNFGGLYGQDFNDPRGLICGGDFSLSSISDAWEAYQIQNKNFQEIFDRQIKNMEIQNKYQRQQDIATAIAGGVQGAVSGIGTGLLISGGNPIAAAAVGVGGALASGIAGIADVNINQALRNEAIDFTKDNFGYQLGNIQALPSTLTKVTSINNNNKIFPLLEYYTCTDREKQALRDKLTYNGMTVMVIGTIGDYIKAEPSYIKGKIIRLPEINEDYHIANEIAREINLGIYV